MAWACLGAAQVPEPLPFASAAPWGISSSAGSSRHLGDWLPKIAAAGVTTVRLFPEWREFEPTKGAWKWDRADALVRTAASNQVEINAILMGSPPAAQKAHALPMQDLDGSTGILLRGDQAASFHVHPSFATFQTREYHVRVSVRRVAPGNLGMNLHYEVADSQGRAPVRNRGEWFSVPDGAGWHTHTWHLTGACFSKMWGCDISIRPEQSVPFVLGKVEVTTMPFR